MRGAAEKRIAAELRWQADACAMIGSPLYAALLRRAAEDVEAHGPVWEVLRGHERDPRFSVLGLRLMGSLNRMALSGEAPRLADAYERRDEAAAWEALREKVEASAGRLREMIEMPVQTNEVGRCAGLLFGFLAVAAETGLPLRLLEAGASAGLNLRWDRFAYAAEGFSWGPADSPLRLEFELRPPSPSPGSAVPHPAMGGVGNSGADLGRVEVAERRGCDAHPVDASTEAGRLTLLSYIWPDQPERIARMRAALEVARKVPATVERDTAAAWTARALAERTPGLATVLYHSIVAQYLSEEERRSFYDEIRAAGERASADAPLAWLRMEPADDRADLHLTTWPGGETRHLARVGYHGNPVELL